MTYVDGIVAAVFTAQGALKVVKCRGDDGMKRAWPLRASGRT